MSDFRIFRGDTALFDIVVKRNGVPVDITGASFRMTIKRSVYDSDLDALASLTVGSGLTVVSPSAGTLTATIPASATNDLPTGSIDCVWDLQMTATDGKVFSVASGRITVVADVSRTTP